MKPLSYSANATLMSCARRYKYTYVDGWQKYEESVPAFAGQCMAQALLHLHTEVKDMWYQDATKAHDEVVAVLRDAYGDFKPFGKHSYMTAGHLELVLYYYMLERDPYEVMPLEESGKILAEAKVTFDWPMVQEDGEVKLIKVTGIPDIPATVAGEPVIVDWKCSSWHLNDWWAKSYTLVGHQLRTYMEMLRHHYGIDVVKGYIDGIHIGKKAAEEPKSWAGLKSKRSHLFGPVTWDNAHKRETWEWYQAGYASHKLYDELDIWPQNEKSCKDYGGCAFQEICSSNPKIRKALLMEQFYQEEDEDA